MTHWLFIAGLGLFGFIFGLNGVYGFAFGYGLTNFILQCIEEWKK